MALNKYVVSLNREGRVKNLYREVEQILRETPSLEILEGAGLKVFTIAMPDSMLAPLTARLRFASISPYQELELSERPTDGREQSRGHRHIHPARHTEFGHRQRFP